MAFSWSELNYPAGTTSVPVDIEYLDKSYIYVYLDDVLTTDYTWSSDTVIQFNTALAAATDVLLVRRTDKEFLYIMFAEGAAFIRENIDTQNTQFLHLAQELTEGRSIEGFYGDLSMNGFRITNLGNGVNPGDAVNKGQLDVVDQRVVNLEQTFIQDTTSYPWYTITTTVTDTLAPPFNFTKAALYINGVCQVPGYSYEVVSNQILLADPVPIGTLIFARLGEDVGTGDEYATAEQLAAAISAAELAHTQLQNNINLKLDATANAVSATKLLTARTVQTNLASTSSASFDGTANITPGVTGTLPTANGGTGNVNGTVGTLTTARTFQTNLASTSAASFDGSANVTPGVTGTLPVANGGTGNTTGLAATATALATARTFQTNLASTASASFNGTANVTPGVTGTLPLSNGGTGGTTAATARTALGAAASGSNSDITALTSLTGGITGLTAGTAAATGIVGEVLSATSGAPVSLTTATAVNIVSLNLPAGEWDVAGSMRYDISNNSTSRQFSISNVSGAQASSWIDVYLVQSTAGSGVTVAQPPTRRFSLTSATTIYMVAQATFTGGTVTGQAYLRATRIR